MEECSKEPLSFQKMGDKNINLENRNGVVAVAVVVTVMSVGMYVKDLRMAKSWYVDRDVCNMTNHISIIRQ
jgi:hypothetical protein